MTDSVHASKQSRVSRGPHDIIHVIRVILERVQRLIVLQGGEKQLHSKRFPVLNV